jgi:hypothetical protein
MKIQIQQLTQNTYYNLSNLDQTFTKYNQYFMDNKIGNLYRIIAFDSNYQVFTIQEITDRKKL